jgi:hypothetical protein
MAGYLIYVFAKRPTSFEPVNKSASSLRARLSFPHVNLNAVFKCGWEYLIPKTMSHRITTCFGTVEQQQSE